MAGGRVQFMSDQHHSGAMAIAPPSRRFKPMIMASALLVATLLGWCTYEGSVRTAPASSEQRASTRRAVPHYVAIAKGQIDLDSGIIRLAASRDGLIREVRVDEGDVVKKGQVLLAMDDHQARLQLALAERELRQQRAALAPLHARLALADREAGRLRPLAADQSVAQQELDRAEGEVAVLRAEIAAAHAAVASAESRVEIAAYEVEQRFVRAPLDGQIVRRQARPGDGVSTLNVTSLFLFAPESPRIVRAELEERFISAVRPGMAAEVALLADESETFRGRVLRVGRVFGQRARPSDDPADKADVRTVECVLSIENQELMIGQRVLVKILPQ